jgi:hypothetical protein
MWVQKLLPKSNFITASHKNRISNSRIWRPRNGVIKSPASWDVTPYSPLFLTLWPYFHPWSPTSWEWKNASDSLQVKNCASYRNYSIVFHFPYKYRQWGTSRRSGGPSMETPNVSATICPSNELPYRRFGQNNGPWLESFLPLIFKKKWSPQQVVEAYRVLIS